MGAPRLLGNLQLGHAASRTHVAQLSSLPPSTSIVSACQLKVRTGPKRKTVPRGSRKTLKLSGSTRKSQSKADPEVAHAPENCIRVAGEELRARVLLRWRCPTASDSTSWSRPHGGITVFGPRAPKGPGSGVRTSSCLPCFITKDATFLR